MRRYAERIGRSRAALLLAVIGIGACAQVAHAGPGSLWAWGWQFTMVSTSDPFQVGGYGMQGGILRRLKPNAWMGLEGGFYEHPLIQFSAAADDWRPYPLLGPRYSSRIAVVTQVGPAWAYRPYFATGLGVLRLTNQRSQGRKLEQTLHVEVGLGLRGANDLLPWFEWRWHRGFQRMEMLGDMRMDYHTWGIGLGWN